jgi:spermidine synthase
VADVFDLLAEHREGYDLIALDTDNGPEWLVRDENARLYAEDGLRLVHAALKPGGVAVFWSPDEYSWFAALLGRVFAGVEPAGADDVVAGRRLSYTMYVCRRDDSGPE